MAYRDAFRPDYVPAIDIKPFLSKPRKNASKKKSSVVGVPKASVEPKKAEKQRKKPIVASADNEMTSASAITSLTRKAIVDDVEQKLKAIESKLTPLENQRKELKEIIKRLS